MTGPGAKDLRFAIIVSSFNDFLTKKLLAGAQEALEESGASEDRVDIFWVPGSFEISLALLEVAEMEYDAAICLGVVIRGETPHFDYVCSEAARGISQVSLNERLPVGFGVITADSTEQAIDRSGGKRGNKGREAALAALRMVEVIDEIKKGR